MKNGNVKYLLIDIATDALKAACISFNIDYDDVVGRTRVDHVRRMRSSWVSSTSYKLDSLSDEEIMRVVNRERSTIFNIRKKHNSDMAGDSLYREMVIFINSYLDERLFDLQEEKLLIEIKLKDQIKDIREAKNIAAKIVAEIPNGLEQLRNFYEMRKRHYENQNKPKGNFKSTIEIVSEL